VVLFAFRRQLTTGTEADSVEDGVKDLLYEDENAAVKSV